MTAPRSGARRTLAGLSVPSEPATSAGRWRRWQRPWRGSGLPDRTLERLKTAVAEATMNAMEHGNHYGRSCPS